MHDALQTVSLESARMWSDSSLLLPLRVNKEQISYSGLIYGNVLR